MSYDPPRPTGRLLLTPQDRDAPARVRRLRRLGLGERAEPAFDVFADRLARVAAAPYSKVTFVGEEQQFFAGLHTPDRGGVLGDIPAGERERERGIGRRLGREYGFCPHVVVRRKALVLEDVRDYPRFAGNPLVDEIGVRSYLGAPLIDSTGIALGTICVEDVEPRPWGKAGLETIKSMAAELAGQLERREGAHGF
ncbi:GAF domain-containing protein [Streptomyces sp. NPDC007084]|uniref:GAF domain-containing protein n=1 Tax=Streptomyces sp. NPDC007084 TaxID=3154313 RepID=UPI0034558186